MTIDIFRWFHWRQSSHGNGDLSILLQGYVGSYCTHTEAVEKTVKATCRCSNQKEVVRVVAWLVASCCCAGAPWLYAGGPWASSCSSPKPATQQQVTTVNVTYNTLWSIQKSLASSLCTLCSPLKHAVVVVIGRQQRNVKMTL
jgi:hypothetical protein